MSSQNPPLTEAAVALSLGMSPATLRAWRQRGVGPSYCRFGRSVRYLSDAVDEFVRASTVVSAADSPSPRGSVAVAQE